MANFYNPYQKGPDWGQGLQDIFQNLMQMLMMMKMFPQQGGQQGMQGGQGMRLPSPNQFNIQGQAPSQFPPRFYGG